MEALMDRELYGRFVARREEMEADEVGSPAHVFVPAGAPIPLEPLRMPRMLYVGKATRGFEENELEGFDGALAGTKKVIEDWFVPGGSAFWQFAKRILEVTATRSGISASAGDLLDHFGWSNLAKIGDTDGNPDSASLKRQGGICQESLKQEIARFRPSATVLVTTNFAEQEVVLPLFSNADWSWDSEDQDSVAFKHHPELGLVVWTNHPQGMRPKGTRARVSQFISDLICSKWSGEPLPPGSYAARIQTGSANRD